MSALIKMLKEEIVRLACREIRKANKGLRLDSARLKRDNAALKRRVARLEADNAFFLSAERRRVVAPVVLSDKPVRITARNVRTMRKRMRLPQAAFAKLVGVTGQTVLNWEKKQGRLRIQPGIAAAIARLKGIKAKEARKLVQVLKPERGARA